MATFKVELEANEWQQVINLMVKYPYDQVAPLIGKMAPQLQQPLPPPANGAEQPKPQAPNG